MLPSSLSGLNVKLPPQFVDRCREGHISIVIQPVETYVHVRHLLQSTMYIPLACGLSSSMILRPVCAEICLYLSVANSELIYVSISSPHALIGSSISSVSFLLIFAFAGLVTITFMEDREQSSIN